VGLESNQIVGLQCFEWGVQGVPQNSSCIVRIALREAETRAEAEDRIALRLGLDESMIEARPVAGVGSVGACADAVPYGGKRCQATDSTDNTGATAVHDSMVAELRMWH
jgi:hypothetical protein